MDLSGKTLLVTGASRGIGRAIVEELAQRDVHILAGMRDTRDFEPVSGGHFREARPVRIDLSSRDEIEACLAELGDEQVDVLVNNAGVFAGGLLESQELDEVYEVIQVNVAGLIHLTRALLPGMQRRGLGKIVDAIESDDEILNPTGAERLAKLASRGPAGLLDKALARAFDR